MSIQRTGNYGPEVMPEIAFFALALENGNAAQDEYMPATEPQAVGTSSASVQAAALRATEDLVLTKLEVQQRIPATTSPGLAVTYTLCTVSDDFLTITPTALSIATTNDAGALLSDTESTGVEIAKGQLYVLRLNHVDLGAAGTGYPQGIWAAVS